MKPFIKAILFLAILTLLEFLLRKGFIAILIPIPLPQVYSIGFLFTLFAICSWLITKWFCKRDIISLHDLGISFSTKNRLEFFYGFLVGVVLWGIVSLVQSATAGFSWVLRPDVSLFSIVYGLVFIFIADLGTELYTRGYPLTRFKDSFGAMYAILIMMVFVGLKSISFEAEGELLLYIILIPVLHTIFFSIVYFKTKRLGAALGLHTGANFVTISIFDLRVAQPGQAIPAGIFQSNVELESLSLTALQLPWVCMAALFSIAVYIWWKK
jgi:membrane protease YdiL (CAAX protease family)